MWAVIILAAIIVVLNIALLIAYLDLRSTVGIMKDTINFQNKLYNECLEGWCRAIELSDNVISLNDDMRKLNMQLLDEFNELKEGDNNERK